MLASFLLLADAAEEGRKVVLSMLAVGLIFLLVIAIGELVHYLSAKRKARTSVPHAVAERCDQSEAQARTPFSHAVAFRDAALSLSPAGRLGHHLD